MGKKKKLSFQLKPLTDKQKAVVLPAMFIISGIAVIIAIFAIIVMPSLNHGARRGVAANGFSAYEEQGTTLGVDKTVTKDDVVAALGNKAKSVSDAKTTNVFNYGGDRSQTVSFDFVRADGKKASLYVDLTQFKSSTSRDNQHIFAETALARIINGNSTYYMHAQTLGSVREYRLLVAKDLNAYKFVIDQPARNITISEVSAAASLMKLIEKAKL